MIEAVIFDLDGTLVTFEFDVHNSRREIITYISSKGIDTSYLNTSMPTQLILNRVFSALGEERAMEVKKGIFEILDRYESISSMKSRSQEGTHETLEWLRKEGINVCVVTNTGRKAATKILQRTGIARYLSFFVTREDVTEMKPSPEGLITAMQIIGARKKGTLFVGDSVLDVIAAKKAGIRVVSVLTGTARFEDVALLQPYAIIRKLPELREIVIKENSGSKRGSIGE